MKTLRLTCWCLVLMLAWGCSHPELTRWYKEIKEIPKDQSPHVSVSVFTMDTPTEAGKSAVSQLSPEGQAALVEQLSTLTKDPQKVMEWLAKPMGPQGKLAGIIDKTVFHKRLVFAVRKTTFLKPADRLNELEVILDLKPGHPKKGVIFASWDKFETAYEIVDLGKISRTHGTSAELAMKLGPHVGTTFPITAEPKMTAEEKIQEELTLKKRYIKMAGAISEDKTEAVLWQEGARDIDLTGTFSVDFNIQTIDPEGEKKIHRTPVTIVGPLSKMVKQEEVQLDFVTLKYIEKAQPIKCNLSFKYILRKVERGDREMVEGYHTVQPFQGGDSKGGIKLVSADELRAVVYEISKPRDKRLYLESPIKPEAPGYPLQFATHGEAKRFLIWLKETKSTKVTNIKLKFKDRPLEKADIPSLIIRPNTLN